MILQSTLRSALLHKPNTYPCHTRHTRSAPLSPTSALRRTTYDTAIRTQHHRQRPPRQPSNTTKWRQTSLPTKTTPNPSAPSPHPQSAVPRSAPHAPPSTAHASHPHPSAPTNNKTTSAPVMTTTESHGPPLPPTNKPAHAHAQRLTCSPPPSAGASTTKPALHICCYLPREVCSCW